MRKRVFAFTLCLICGIGTWNSASSGVVVTANSGSSTDIQAAIDRTNTGDTVAIPAGRFPFTGQVYAPDGIHIMGAGRDSTYLIKSDDLSEWHAMITVDSKTGQPFIFSGITLQGRLDVLQEANRTTAQTTVKDQCLLIKGAATKVQIFDSRFTKFLRAGIEFSGQSGTKQGQPTGVIYNNEFVDNWYPYLGYAIAVNGAPSSWNGPVTLGSADALFIEDNLFDRNRHCVTGNNGAIYVARYNTVKDNYQDAAAFDAHGLTPSWPRGTRSVEIYKNTVTNSITRWAGAGIRGGSGVIWGNTWKGVWHGVALVLEIPPSTNPLTTYPALDQIGNPDDLYIWSNTSSGDDVYKMPTSDKHGIDYWLMQNRDYFLGPKAGYTPYTYPHPLRAYTAPSVETSPGNATIYRGPG
jgi:hypothetical protein